MPEFAVELHRTFLVAQREARRSGKCLTVTALARRLAVSVSSLYAYLAGTTLPPGEVLDALLVELGVNGDRYRRLADARDDIEIGRRVRTRGSFRLQDKHVG